MGLAGELTTIDLSEVFQSLAFRKLTGVLKLEEAGRTAELYFDEGRIRALALSDREIDYLAVARRCGFADEDTLEKATRRRRTLKAFLRSAGGLDEPTYDATVAQEVGEEILPLFGWLAGSFTFEEGKPKKDRFDREQLDCAIDIDPQGLAMEAARRHDEWETLQAYVPAEKEHLVTSGADFPGDVDHRELKLLELCDGTRDFAAVLAETPMVRHEVFRAVARFVEAGVLLTASPDRLRDLANQAKVAGRINLAVRRLEKAVELDGSCIETRKELVRLYERAGRKEDAAEAQRQLAEVLVQGGDLEAALEAFERAHILAPDNLEALERILELGESRGDEGLTLRAGRRLARAMRAKQMHEDARFLYERLLEGRDSENSMREEYAHCLLEIGETAPAVAQLCLVGGRAWERKDYESARRIYGRVLELDGECEEAVQRLETIESGELRRRAHRRQKRRFATLLLILAALVAWQLVREGTAMEALHETEVAAVEMLALDHGDESRLGVLDRYAQISRDHPFTRAGRLAEGAFGTLVEAEIRRLELVLEQAPEARTTSEIEYHLRRAERLLDCIEALPLGLELRKHWDEARDRFTLRISELRKS